MYISKVWSWSPHYSLERPQFTFSQVIHQMWGFRSEHINSTKICSWWWDFWPPKSSLTLTPGWFFPPNPLHCDFWTCHVIATLVFTSTGPWAVSSSRHWFGVGSIIAPEPDLCPLCLWRNSLGFTRQPVLIEAHHVVRIYRTLWLFVLSELRPVGYGLNYVWCGSRGCLETLNLN